MEEDRKIEETTRSRLELDHAIGYTGHFANTCLYHPKKPRTIVYNTGTVLVVSDISSVPHKQQFIHGHDAEISAICLSKSGKFLASGQLGSSKIAGDVAPVLVWDLDRLSNVYVFDILKYDPIISSTKSSCDPFKNPREVGSITTCILLNLNTLSFFFKFWSKSNL